LGKRAYKSIVYARKTSQRKLLTSSGETADSWASRETSVSLAFFERLRLRVAGIFLTDALVSLGTISWVEGSSATTGEVEGATVVSFGGSLSSLQEETSYEQHKRNKASMVQSQNSKKTYDAKRSKYSISSSTIGAVLAAVL
jgi:hypothetical protein